MNNNIFQKWYFLVRLTCEQLSQVPTENDVKESCKHLLVQVRQKIIVKMSKANVMTPFCTKGYNRVQ